MPDSAVDTLQERIFDASITIEKIVHLGVQLATEYIEDDLMEWLEDEARDTLAAALGVTPAEFVAAVNEYGGRRSERQEAMSEVLRPLTGWLVEVSGPRIDWDEERKSGSVHMGWRTSAVLYGDSYDEALEAAITWGEVFTAPPWAGAGGDPC